MPSIPDIRALIEGHVPPTEIRADGIWLRVREERLDPAQRSGWKLHISATPRNYIDILQRAVPALAKAGLPFKLLRSIEEVEENLDGRHGLPQVGKTMAVYPPDEAESARIAAVLAKALSGYEGVAIVTDQRFQNDAPVYFRYGPYDNRYTVDALGQAGRVMWHPEAGEVVDATAGGDTPPPAVAHLPQRPAPDHLAWLRDGYLPVKLLQLTAKGGTFLAVSKAHSELGPVLLKTARAGAQADRFGRDALWALAQEHAMLQHLQGLPGIPDAGVLLRDGDRAAALVRPYIEGETFWALWTRPDGRSRAGRQRLVAVLRDIAEQVETLHAQGILLRDLSPGNILLAEGKPIFLDLELAQEAAAAAPGFRRGTVGFYDPQRERFAVAGVGDDHYALLALAFMAHAGVHPVLLQGPQAHWPETQPAGKVFTAAWERAVAVRGSDEFAAAYAQVADAVGEAWAPAVAAHKALEAFHATRQARLNQAAAHIVARAEADPENPEVYNFYDGVAGLVVAKSLMGLGTAPGLERVWPEPALTVAEQLVHVPGMYFGASGVGFAALVAGVQQGDDTLVRNGIWFTLQAGARESSVPDLCQGMAGLLSVLMASAEVTEGEALRGLAEVLGARLIGLAEAGEAPNEETAQGLLWPWPKGGYGTLSGARLYGYGHGTAGVVSVLLQLWQVSDRDWVRDAAIGGLATLHRAARPLGDDACWWPPDEEDDTCWNAWCHGTPGVVKALSIAVGCLGREEDRVLLEKALRGVMMANNGGFCLCHGVASRLDAYADALPQVHGEFRKELKAAAARDVALLASLDLEQVQGATGEPALGLMTGPLGVLHALERWRQARAG